MMLPDRQNSAGKIMKPIAYLAASAALLAACSGSGAANLPDADMRSSFNRADLEQVYAWRAPRPGDLTVRTPSNGCTTKDSFELDVRGAPRSGWAFDVSLKRISPDHCRAYLPDGVELVWTREELGLPPSAEIRLLNAVRR
jgi:hypothetical protein